PLLPPDLSSWLDPVTPRPLPSPLPSPCYAALRDLPAHKKALFLDRMGDLRFAEKEDRFRQRIAEQGIEQALYEGIMEALGYKNNRFPCWILARRLPLRLLRQLEDTLLPPDPPLFRQALFLGAGNLLPSSPPTPDRETVHYVNQLRHHWEMGRQVGEMQAEPLTWDFTGMRPANTPFRRLAALSHLLSRFSPSGFASPLVQAVTLSWQSLQQGKSPGRALAPLHRLLQVDDDPYWSYRYTLGGKRLSRASRLLGNERIRTLLVDVVLPTLCAWARSEQRSGLVAQIHHLYTCHPCLGDNAILRHMRHQLGEEGSQPSLITTARRQQALLHLYHHFCREENPHCPECALLTLVRSL
ncbi:MAG: DUF2851 family protein, partial [Nitrospinota bacterium]